MDQDAPLFYRLFPGTKSGTKPSSHRRVPNGETSGEFSPATEVGGLPSAGVSAGRTTTETRQKGIQHTRLAGRKRRGGSAGLAPCAEVRGDDRGGQNRQIRPRRRDRGTGATTASRADVQDSRDTQ